MTWIKICGITNAEDALEASALGADALGFIFAPSPRRIDRRRAREIIREIAWRFPPVKRVGVFVNEDIEEVRRIADDCGLDIVQFHGEETPEYCRKISLPVIKAISVKDVKSLEEMDKYPFASILLDAWSKDRQGGTGKTFHWEMALEVRKEKNFILSGGLIPGNVKEAIYLLKPDGVDVCSGVELAFGKKDRHKLNEFIKEVKKADAST